MGALEGYFQYKREHEYKERPQVDVIRDFDRLHRMETDEIVEYAYNLQQEIKEYQNKIEEIRDLTTKLEMPTAWQKGDEEVQKVCVEVLNSYHSRMIDIINNGNI